MNERPVHMKKLGEEKLPLKEGTEFFEGLWGGGVPDAFSVLARRVTPRGKTPEEKTAGYSEKDVDIHGNVGGSHGGVVALRTLRKYFPRTKLVTNSFVAKSNERHAEVAAKELQVFGIPKEDIIVQDRSFSTLTEILENIKLLIENDWKHLVVLVNGTQLDRANAILEKAATMADPANYRSRPGIAEALEKFEILVREGKAKITIVASEDVVARKSLRHAALIVAVKKTLQWRRTKEKDDEMAKKVYDGTYGQSSGHKPVIQ